MEQRTFVCELLSIYKTLLTKTQYDIMSDFYLLDLTQSEIAENKEVSRQSINDCITLCTERLLQLEKDLKVKAMQDLLATAKIYL